MNFYNRHFKGRSEEEINRTVLLAPLIDRLTLLARAITGENIEIQEAEMEGGWKSNLFFLPSKVSFLDSVERNLNFYLYRIVYLSVQFEQDYNWDNSNQTIGLTESRTKAASVSEDILLHIANEFPPVYKYYHSI